MRLIGSLSLACAAASGLCGCVVGPNYSGPPALAREAHAFQRASAAVDPSSEPPERWWTALADPELDREVAAALAASPTLEAAQARLRQSRAELAGERAGLLPSSGGSAAYVRTRNLTTLFGSGEAASTSGALNLYAVGFDATWEMSLFGAQVRAVQAAAAAVQSSQASLAGLEVSLSAEVAQAYVELRNAEQRLALTERDIGIESHLLELYRLRQGGGTASALDVARVMNQLETTRATLPPLRAAVAEQLDRLAVLSGRVPGALDQELATPAPPPSPPAHVAIGNPAALLRRRPDIIAAERTLAERTAEVGEQVAGYFPKVNLLGEVGFASLTPGALLSGSNFSYVLAPILQWTPLDFGRNRARVGAARAAREEAEADYRRTVLGALEDAEDSLARYGEQRNSVEELARARASAEKVYSLTEIRLRGGTADTTDVLDADRTRIQAELDYQQALASLTEDFIALQKSLGLGWADPNAR